MPNGTNVGCAVTPKAAGVALPPASTTFAAPKVKAVGVAEDAAG